MNGYVELRDPDDSGGFLIPEELVPFVKAWLVSGEVLEGPVIDLSSFLRAADEPFVVEGGS